VRLFSCPRCGAQVHFENDRCVVCDAELGLRWPLREIVLAADPLTRCVNTTLAGCNWLVEVPGELCASCRLTATRPADDDAAGLHEFRVAEAAKRWLLFELGELDLPIVSAADVADGLTFDLLSSAREPVATGHAEGRITLDLAEADPAHREAVRLELAEPYRTVLGHFRHEVGHYYQDLLAPEGSNARNRCRALFGDDRIDYEESRQRYYATGANPAWRERFVSAYATMHPWEDWAETFAHYLHIRDALQTASAYGLSSVDSGARLSALVAEWQQLSISLNAMNRSLGLPDPYPFVLTAAVVEKLVFIDELVQTGPFSVPG
jgi:hypothetical protein